MEPRDAVEDALRRGKRAALVRVTAIEGSPPSREGLSLAVVEDGTVSGTLGCDGFDRAGTRDALVAIERHEVLRSRYDWDESSRIAVEVRPFAPGEEPPTSSSTSPELLVVGAGPVARALVAQAKPLGFRIRVLAGPGFPNLAEFAGADEVVPAPDLDAVRALRTTADSYVVICGHDEEFSQPALRALLRGDARYLGMMGSRRHTGHLLDALRAEGFDDERVRRVHSPVGLDIGAETPEEIATSALAQVIAIRRGRTGRPPA